MYVKSNHVFLCGSRLSFSIAAAHIPLYEYATIYLFILLLMNIWLVLVCGHYKKAAIIFLCMSFEGHMHSAILGINYLGYVPRNRITGSGSRLVLSFRKYCWIVFWSDYINLHTHKQCMRVLVAPHPCEHLVVSAF